MENQLKKKYGLITAIAMVVGILEVEFFLKLKLF